MIADLDFVIICNSTESNTVIEIFFRHYREFRTALIESGEKRGMVIDFGDLKNAVNQLADSFDHTLIYEENSLSDAAVKVLREEGFSLTKVPFRPTAENFAAHFYKTLRASGLEVSAVKVYETPNNCAVYEEDK